MKSLYTYTVLLVGLLSLATSHAELKYTEMVTVPAGYFQMGCNKKIDPDCYENEMPLHRVWLKKFKIDKYEATYDRYQKCIAEGSCKPLGQGGACNFGWPNVGDLPVNCVTWENAKTMCEFEGKRLPTEAEWEKAARGPKPNLYPWGNEEPNCNLAVMDGSDGGNLACGKGLVEKPGTRPMGASPYGAMDMAGNYWEWTADYYGHYYYYSSPESNPKGPWSGDYRVARGGDLYARKAWELRTVARFPYDPVNYSPAVGFRCAQ
ncbi:SUMF1/EgtB/PvdO family nonheme iron enzyme [Maricurvus nonylphenolicus]|uniref:formylglycine-generating enzyme family protein n=1 Tax=Maricurvus nonylphenolicus TaxID=1008307 RepID=UPI0036F370A7